MNKKARKPLSVLLVLAMISSLFAGTAVGGQGRNGKKVGLFEGVDIPTVLLTESGRQFEQSFTIGATPSKAVAAATKSEATSSEAKLSVELTDDQTITIKPEDNATPSNADKKASITVTAAEDMGYGTKFTGEINLAWNWFENGTEAVDFDVAPAVVLQRSGLAEKAASETAYKLTYGEKDITDAINVDFAADDRVIITEGKNPVKEQTEARLEFHTEKTTIGLCDITITPKKADPETRYVPVFKSSSVTLTADTKTAELPLTAEASEMLNDISFNSDNEAVSVSKDGILTINNEGTATITASYAGGSKVSLKNNTYVVTVKKDHQGKFFENHDGMRLYPGEARRLPVVASASEAIANGKATITSSNKAAADIVDKSSDKGIFVKAGKPETETTVIFTITEDDKWDEYEVTVSPMMASKLIDLTPEERADGLSMAVGENLSKNLTEKALELLEDETLDGIITSNAPEIADAEFGPSGELVFSANTEGTAKFVLRIGGYEDTCAVNVTANYSDILDGILNDVKDDMTKDEITVVVDALKDMTKQMTESADPDQFNKLETEEEQEKVAAQMEKLDKVHDLILKNFPNVKAEKKATVKAASLQGKTIEVIGLALNADLGDKGSQNVELVMDDTKVPVMKGEKVTKSALALNIELCVNGKEISVKSPLQVVMDSPLATENLVVYHIHNGKVSKYNPIVKDGKVTIYITQLSTFVFDYADPDEIETPVYNYSSSSRSSGGSGLSANKGNRNLYAMSGSWELVENSWKFKKLNGYYAKNEWGFINNFYYYFGDDQLMKTGWVYVRNMWYYLNPAAGSEAGKMLTGWQQVNGVWYYLNTASDGIQGAMKADQWVDGYYVDASGARIQ